LGSLCAIAIFAQLIVGATMRHNGAGLAIPDLPLAYGKLLPPMNQVELATVNQYRTWELHEKPVTLAQVWLHFGHRLGAIIVSVALIGLIAMSWLRSRSGSIHIAAGIVASLLLTQFTLGVLTVYWKKPADIASLHVACGALLLMSTVVLTTMAARLYSEDKVALAARQCGLSEVGNLPMSLSIK
jgi:cytochrome c oxidase assembly protein subunit 15